MNHFDLSIAAKEAKQLLKPLRNSAFLVALIALPELAFAGPPSTPAPSAADFADDACTFVNNIVGLLKIASVAVVTIAIIFAGYQIAFAHKRIADVAPILIGGLFIGAAGQIAGWVLQKEDADCTAAIVTQGLQYFA